MPGTPKVRISTVQRFGLHQSSLPLSMLLPSPSSPSSPLLLLPSPLSPSSPSSLSLPLSRTTGGEGRGHCHCRHCHHCLPGWTRGVPAPPIVPLQRHSWCPRPAAVVVVAATPVVVPVPPLALSWMAPPLLLSLFPLLSSLPAICPCPQSQYQPNGRVGGAAECVSTPAEG
jgi:hypothetical protein